MIKLSRPKSTMNYQDLIERSEQLYQYDAKGNIQSRFTLTGGGGPNYVLRPNVKDPSMCTYEVKKDQGVYCGPGPAAYNPLEASKQASNSTLASGSVPGRGGSPYRKAPSYTLPRGQRFTAYDEVAKRSPSPCSYRTGRAQNFVMKKEAQVIISKAKRIIDPQLFAKAHTRKQPTLNR